MYLFGMSHYIPVEVQPNNSMNNRHFQMPIQNEGPSEIESEVL